MFLIASKNKKVLGRYIIIFGFIGALISLLIEPRFDSRISFYSKKNESSSMFSNFDVSQLLSSQSPFTLDHDFNIIDIIESHDVYEYMVTYNFESISQSLISYWEIDKNFLEVFNFDFLEKNKDIKKQKELNQSVKKLKRRISFDENKKSGLISISISLEERNLSKEFLEVFYEKISEILIDVNSEKYESKIDFLTTMEMQYKNELYNTDDVLIDFIENNRSFADSPQLLSRYEKIKRKINLYSAAYERILADLEGARIQKDDSIPLLVILDSPNIAHKKSFPERKIITLFFGFLGILVFYARKLYKGIYLNLLSFLRDDSSES